MIVYNFSKYSPCFSMHFAIFIFEIVINHSTVDLLLTTKMKKKLMTITLNLNVIQYLHAKTHIKRIYKTFLANNIKTIYCFK